MSDGEKTLKVQFDGKSNVVSFIDGEVTDGEVARSVNCLNLGQRPTADGHTVSIPRNFNCVAQSTDYMCSQPGCTYHHSLLNRYILHARSHFVFETSPDAKGCELRYSNGKYVCSKCPRSTRDAICFGEHIRHHLFSKPYRCKICEFPIDSVPHLRVHFQQQHPSLQADFLFNTGGSVPDTIVSALAPDAPPVVDAVKFSFSENRSASHLGGVNIRIWLNPSPSASPSVGAPSEFTNSNGNARPARQVSLSREISSFASGDGSDAPVKENSPAGKVIMQKTFPALGRYVFRDDAYSCVNCCYKTFSVTAFRAHVWNHVHGSWAVECQHMFGGSHDCAVVTGLIQILKTTTKKSDDSRKEDASVAHERTKAVKKSTKKNATPGSLTFGQNDAGTKSRKVKTPVTSVDAEKVAPAEKVPAAVGDSRDAEDSAYVFHDNLPLKRKCGVCSFTCNNANQLNVHLRTGHMSRRKQASFNCMECDMTTQTREVLIWHLSHHLGDHSVQYFVCSNCDFESMIKKEMDNHITAKHSQLSVESLTEPNVAVPVTERVSYLQNILKCPVCHDGLLWKNVFVSHLKKVHSLVDLARFVEQNYPDSCPASIKFPISLLPKSSRSAVTGLTEVTASKSLIDRLHCESCEFSSNSYEAYVRHRRYHTEMTKPGDVDKTETATAVNNKPKTVSKKSTSKKSKKVHRKVKPADHGNALLYKADRSRSRGYSSPYSTTNTSTHVVEEHIPTLPKSLGDSTLADFEKKLPDSFVFQNEIKCPKCSFKSRIRVNLIRHLKSAHEEQQYADLPASSSVDDTLLSYRLWQPDDATAKDKSSVFVADTNPAVPPDETSSSSIVSGESAGRISPAPPQATAVTKRLEWAPQRRVKRRERSVKTGSTTSAAVDKQQASESSETSIQPPVVEPEVFSCEFCSESFSSSAKLERHTTSKHASHQCNLCGMLILQESSIEEHYRTEHGTVRPVSDAVRKQQADDPYRVTYNSTAKKKKVPTATLR